MQMLSIRGPRLGLKGHLTNVRSDRVGGEMGRNVEHPVAAHVVWHRDRLTEISIQLWERGLEVGRWWPVLR